MFRIAFATILIFLVPTARAEPPDVLSRLMAEPVTLFDWGLAQLDRDIDRAAKRTLPSRAGAREPRSGTIYDWRTKQITLYVSRVVPSIERTPETCRLIFKALVGDLTETSPGGSSAAGWYLHNAFQPKGHVWTSRFEDVGAKLLEVVTLEVSLLPPTAEAFNGQAPRARCRGRLDADGTRIAVDDTPSVGGEPEG